MQKLKIKNLHISTTQLTNETRIVKEAQSLIKRRLVSKIAVLGLQSDTLKKQEIFSKDIIFNRIRLRTRPLPKNAIFQILKYFEFAYKISSFAIKMRPKIVTVHSLALLPLGCFLKILLKAKLVYDAHELETETYELNGFKKTGLKILEKYLIKWVDLTIVVSQSINKWYKKTYKLKSIITVLNAPNYTKIKKGYALQKILKISKKKKILIYLGGLIRGRGIEELLQEFIKIRKNKYALVFMGYGYLISLIKKYSTQYKNIYFLSAVKPDQVICLCQSADYGIAFIKNGSLNDFYCLPNKFFEYIFSGLPVVVNESPEMGRIVKKFGIGKTIKVLKQKTLVSALSNLDKWNKIKLRKRIEKICRRMCWRVQERRLLLGYKGIINRKKFAETNKY
jgi:glycosyltransferase involved in cell wall biosynthesis